MKLLSLATAVSLLGSVSTAPLEARTSLETDQLAADGVLKLGLYIASKGYPNPKCTLQNVSKRREW